MATWVEDIVQALENLGGQAHRKDIFEEIKRIRKEPLPSHFVETAQSVILAHSSDSTYFQGVDIFEKKGDGVWALRTKKTGDQIVSGQDLISDNGLFIDQAISKFTISESFETVINIFHTVKQYRDFAHPDDASWFGYIRDFFNALSFNIEDLAPRLIGLHDFGTYQKPKTLVCIVGPKENFTEIAYGIDWKSYLFYASRFYQTDWVILTNGLEFTIFNFSKESEYDKTFKCELDEIIQQGKTDSFFTLYKVITAITRDKSPKNTPTRTSTKAGSVLTEQNNLRRDFWDQLLQNPKKTDSPFRNIKTPADGSFMNAGSGKTGIAYTFIVALNQAKIQLYIDNRDKNWNKQVFDTFFEHKEEIEKVFGDSLKWDRLDTYRASVIRYYIGNTGLQNKEEWNSLQEKMIEAMIKFERALQPYIKRVD